MINLILCILFQSLPGPVVAVCLENMLTPRPSGRMTREKRILSWTLLYLVISSIRLAAGTDAVMVVMNGALFLGVFVLLKYFYTDKWWKRWTVIILHQVLLVLADLLVTIGIFFLSGGKRILVEYSRSETVVASAAVTLLGCLFFLGAYEIWRRVVKKERGMKYPVLFIVVLIPEVMTLCVFYLYIYRPGEGRSFQQHILTMAIIFTTSALGVVLFHQSEKDAMKVEMQEIRHLSELEQAHYQEIEKRREEMAKIRHDYNNQLASVRFLLRSGKIEESDQMLAALSERIESTREYPYCGIPIINAILSEKKLLCEEQGTRLTAEISLPDELSVNNLDLCSALGNLLDNAIRACGKLTNRTEDGETENSRITGNAAAPEIRLSCGIRNGYLIVKTVNPSGNGPGVKPEGTGYGHKILRDLAKRYQGDFFTEYKDGTFTAQLSLRV